LKSNLKKVFLTGLAVLLPIGLTFYILSLIKITLQNRLLALMNGIAKGKSRILSAIFQVQKKASKKLWLLIRIYIKLCLNWV